MQCGAEGDHVTRILKAYGDALEGPDIQQGPAFTKVDVSTQETYLRCVVLLVRLTGQYVARFLPQVLLPHAPILFSTSCAQGAYQLRVKSPAAAVRYLSEILSLLVICTWCCVCKINQSKM